MTEVLFCNFCDQSVPQQQLDDGDAIRHGGRVVCPTCSDTLSMAVRGHKKGGSGGASGAVGAIFGILALAGVAYLYWQGGQQAIEQTDVLNDAVVDMDRAQEDLETRLGRRFDALGSHLDELRGDLGDGNDRATAQAQDLATHIDQVGLRIDDLEPLKDGQQSLRDSVQRVQARLGLVEDGQRELRSGQEFLRDSFAQVQREVAAAQVPEPADSGFSSEVEALLEKLKADDPLARVDALQKLGRFNDSRLVAYVEPLLEDNYEMNRFYAAYTLGEWEALTSVPRLIPVLEDRFAFVRQSANEALVKITKEDMGFEEKGSEADRAKAVSRWQDWAKQHEDELAPASSGS
jgi:hypothetical protein